MNDSIIAKIQKLLRLASEGNPSQEEAAAALAKAQQLMMEHEIESLDLKEKPEVDEFSKHFIAEPFDRAPASHTLIAQILQKYFHVKVLYCPIDPVGGMYFALRRDKRGRISREEIPQFAFLPKGKRGMQLIGRKSHLLIAEYVFVFLSWEFDQLWSQHQHETGKGAYAKLDFFKGLYQGLSQRLRNELHREEREMPVEQCQKFALVKADEDKALSDYFRQEFPDVQRRGYGRETRDVDSYEDGKRAGQRLNIRPAVNEGRGTKLLKD
jgi:uncharacterized protein DUF2786